VSTVNPTRAALLELQEERHAMREGHVFLDEKCLLLAGEMLRQLQRHAQLQAQLDAASETALRALHAALARHGLQGLQLQPALLLGAPDRAGSEVAGSGAPRETPVQLSLQPGTLMGVRLQDARLVRAATAPPSGLDQPAGVNPSPELRACREAFQRLLDAAAPLAAVSGNLERLSQEYRRSVRRARALQDVLLPALERDVAEIQTRLEELEQQDAIAMRRQFDLAA
jgi:V/A-type H+/Na+-transporting ATPase subunit D